MLSGGSVKTENGRRILLLGSTGKMGRALAAASAPEDELICHNSRSFDAADLAQVRRIIEECRPDMVLNTVAFLGIDPCEREPDKAFRINTLYPKFLAECSARFGFVLAHFSTDAVFSDKEEGAYCETDAPCPVNIYGFTKFGGDCFVRALAPGHYLFRLSLLFGPTDRQTQFVERMLARIRGGEKSLKIADDIIFSPGYSQDIAAAVMQLIKQQAPFGLYHLANSGTTSLYGLLGRIVEDLGCDVRLERGSHRDFPAIGRKNTRTPIVSGKIPPLRPWEEAVDDYCRLIAEDWRK